MSRESKIWLSISVFVIAFGVIAPAFLFLFEKPFLSQSLAYGTDGMLFGYDVIGRPILPQLLVGGRDLIFSSIITAGVSRGLGIVVGLYFHGKSKMKFIFSFILDAILVLPAVLVSLACYNAFKGSVYAIIPIATILTVPYNSRYYKSLSEPIFKSAFFEYRSIYEKSKTKLIISEIIPILMKNIMVDVASSFITSIYMISSISFISSAGDGNFLWPKILSENLPGFNLNPWASICPLVLIILLCAPLNFLVDSIRRKK